MFGIDDLLIGGLVGSALGGLGSTLGSFFGDGDERMPENRANEYLNRLPGILESHYKPFEEAGIRAIPTLEQQYAKLLNNPEILMNQIGAGHRASPGYEFKKDQAIKAAEQAAAAGGMLGAPSTQESLAKTITGLADQDYYNYLQNALGLFGMGLGGTGNLANLGYNAASSLGENLANANLSQANLAYSTGQNELTRKRGAWGGLGNALGTIGGAMLPGIFSRPQEQFYGYNNPNANWSASYINPGRSSTGSGYVTDNSSYNMFG